jgi:hypothetical protein
MTIDWSEAPEGATHYDPTVWYRKKGSAWEYYYGGEWRTSDNEPDYNERLTPLPVVVWRGPQDGLPPVGTEVEAESGYSWKRGTVVARVWEACFGDTAIIQCKGYWVSRRADGIRPIKTERERAIEEMLKDMPDDINAALAAALYDAGYRKGEPT